MSLTSPAESQEEVAGDSSPSGYDIVDSFNAVTLSPGLESLLVWKEPTESQSGHFGNWSKTPEQFEILNLKKKGMPRAKRRAPASNHADDVPQNPPGESSWRPAKRTRQSTRRQARVDEGAAAEQQRSFSQKRCMSWFREYTTADDPDTLGPEGMEKFCEDIGVEPENIVMLVLAYKMNARQMGFFTLAEWLKGFTELQCDSIAKIKQKLDYLRCVLNDPNIFKAIYRYAYDFARDKDQRSMDMETARAMLQLLLGRHWSLFSQFAKFLEQSKYKVINKDQWCNILEFSRSIQNDLSNYDLDGAWPVMLDEFVEWLKAQQSDPTGNQMDTWNS